MDIGRYNSRDMGFMHSTQKINILLLNSSPFVDWSWPQSAWKSTEFTRFIRDIFFAISRDKNKVIHKKLPSTNIMKSIVKGLGDCEKKYHFISDLINWLTPKMDEDNDTDTYMFCVTFMDR